MPKRCVADAQELREMVIRGAYEHPGAVAVEDEMGRVILLHKLPLNVTFPYSTSANNNFNTSSWNKLTCLERPHLYLLGAALNLEGGSNFKALGALCSEAHCAPMLAWCPSLSVMSACDAAC